MAKIDRGVFDTGPFLHFYEIQGLQCLEVVKQKCITPEINDEARKYKLPFLQLKNVQTIALIAQSKNFSKMIAEDYALDLGEATAIALALQEKIRYFFSDDLDARDAGKKFRLEVHGTLGILMRGVREKIITKKEALLYIKKLNSDSTLFLTKDLVDWIVKELQNYPI